MKIKNKIVTILLILTALSFSEKTVRAQQATWIWYPGDYDIWLANKMQNRRTERGTFFPPFWRLYSHYVLVDFHKDYNIGSGEEIEIYTEGRYNISIDSKLLNGVPERVLLPAGKHTIDMKVFCQANVPAIFIKGKSVVSDSSWLVTYEDKEWIDESGKTSDKSGTTWLYAAYWDFNDPKMLPSSFRLKTSPEAALTMQKKGNTVLVDFGKETFGYIRFFGLKGKGKLHVYYGESKEEALSVSGCETLDHISVDQSQKEDFTYDKSRAFRYVNIIPDENISFDSVAMLYEYLPEKERGTFSCSDELINKIWNVSAYTLHLNTREFFIDGIKRDRWIWSGDAYQSYLMNYYLFFDSQTVCRTLAALRGKDPVTSHINTIMDYTFYWFLGVYDYYRYTGDETFIRQFYPRMVSMMDFCLNRRNADGMMVGKTGDWVYVDWAPMDKHGELSFEQILFTRSLETMALCSNLVHDSLRAEKYTRLATDLQAKLIPYFWSPKKKAFVHNRVNGIQSEKVTRYSNMFAIFYDYLDNEKKQEVKQHVLLNDSIQHITTPYMRFYELEALCSMGEQSYVLDQIRDYWGGMLNAGATTFWEKYDPSNKGGDHYSMYGRPFGKSLCHAWGASPIYLLGKYFLGVQPSSPGYETYNVTPVLGGLKWMEGSVPTPKGDIHVYCNINQIKIKSDMGTGTLHFKSKTKPSCKNGIIVDKGGSTYEMTIEMGEQYVVNYKEVK